MLGAKDLKNMQNQDVHIEGLDEYMDHLSQADLDEVYEEETDSLLYAHLKPHVVNTVGCYFGIIGAAVTYVGMTMFEEELKELKRELTSSFKNKGEKTTQNSK